MARLLGDVPALVGDLGERVLDVAGARVAGALAMPVAALSAVPAWQFRNWQWIALALTAPLVGWAVRRCPPGPAGLLAVTGPVAALVWSLHLLLLGGAGVPGHTQPLADGIPFGSAAVLAALVLVGPPAWLAEHGVAAPDPGAATGHTAMAVAWDGVARGLLHVEHTLRPGVAATTAALARRGVTVIPAASGSKATLLPSGGGRVALLPRGELADVARAVRRQHRAVAMLRACVASAAGAAVGGAALALVGVLTPATAGIVPVVSAALVAGAARSAATPRTRLPPSRVWVRPRSGHQRKAAPMNHPWPTITTGS